MAGAMPPTEPGPGMFPATAAAWAAAAACAVAACCCICLWHWRKSNTCQATRQKVKTVVSFKNNTHLQASDNTYLEFFCFSLFDHCIAISPWCKRWGRSCELRLQGHVQPLDPSNSSAQTLHDHSNSAPRRLLHLCTPAVRLCQCGA